MSTRTILGTAAMLCMAALSATGTAQSCYPSYGYSPFASYGTIVPTQYVRGTTPLRVGGATVFFGPGGGYYGQAYAGYCGGGYSGYGYPSVIGYGYSTGYGNYGYSRVSRNYRGW